VPSRREALLDEFFGEAGRLPVSIHSKSAKITSGDDAPVKSKHDDFHPYDDRVILFKYYCPKVLSPSLMISIPFSNNYGHRQRFRVPS
jgi:hypothetical protein